MEHDELFLAAQEGDIATIEKLIYVEYIDVNSMTTCPVRITGCHIAMYVYMYSNHIVAIYVHAYKSSTAFKLQL